MKRKVFSVLLAFVLVLSMSLVTAVPAGAVGDTWYVATTGSDDFGDGTETWVDVDTSEDWTTGDTGPWLTIQHAIGAAFAGDTIIVAAGTYNERVNINESLTLEGANAGIPATEERGPESIINPQGLGLDFGVLIDGANTIATFDGFMVENYERAGILAGGFSVDNDPVEVHILNNIVTQPIGQHNNNCIQVGDGTTGTVIGNEVMGANLESPDWSGSGILVAGSNNVVVSNNHVYDCEGGIQICGYAEYRDAPAVNNLVENNLVEDCVAGISIQMNSIGTIISDNDVLNNDVGIGSVGNASWEPTIPSGTEIHHNNTVGNVNYGVKSSVWDESLGPPEQVDATNNWWGAASGPYHPTANPNGTGDAVSDNVLFEPWLTAEGGAAVAMTAEMPEIVAISVDPTSINFGTLYPGESSVPTPLTISNIGTLDVYVDTLVYNDQGAEAGFFYDNLLLFYPPDSPVPEDAKACDYDTSLSVGDPPEIPIAQVIVPIDYAAVGSVTGTLVFVAAETTP